MSISEIDVINNSNCGKVASNGTRRSIHSAEAVPADAWDEGTLSVPDPNTFGGPLKIRLRGEQDWTEIPLTRPFAENSRGIGLADMLHAHQTGGDHRAGGDLALHVLDVMHTILESAEAERTLIPRTRVQRPAPLDVRPEWYTTPQPA